MNRSPLSPVRTARYILARRLVICLAVVATLLLLGAFPQAAGQVPAAARVMTSRKLFLNSFGLAAATAMVAVPVGLILAWLVSRTNLPGRRLLLGGLLVGATLPLYMHAAVWEAGFGQLGWFQAYRSASTPLLSGWRGAWWVHVMAAVPWVVLLTVAQLRSVTPDLEELALVDASPRQVFWHVTLVHAYPAAVFATLWIIVWVAGEMTVTDLYQVRTFAEEVYIGFAVDTVGGQHAVSPTVMSGICFTSVLTLLALAACLIIAPRLETVEQPERVFRFDLGRWRWLMMLLAILAVTCMILIPLGNLVYQSGVEVQTSADQPTRIWRGTKAALMTVQSLWQFREEFGWSLAICQLASLGAVLASILLYMISQRATLARIVCLSAAACSLALSGPLLGVGIVRLFTAMPGPIAEYVYSYTIAAPWLAMVIKCFPLSLGLTWIAMRLMPKNLDEAARNAGASTWQSLWYVVIPTRLTAVVVVFLAGLVYCLGDLAASILVVPPGVMTLAISIFGMIHSGVEDRLAALCLACVGILSILGVVIWWSSRLVVGDAR